MNIYEIYDKETGKTGTCYNLSELSRVLNISRKRLLGGNCQYVATKIGDHRTRLRYKDIDDIYQWWLDHSTEKKTFWISRSRMNVTAWDNSRDNRSTVTAMVHLLFSSNSHYGTYHELDDVINNDNWYNTLM